MISGNSTRHPARHGRLCRPGQHHRPRRQWCAGPARTPARGSTCNFNGDTMVVGGTAPGTGNVISGNGSHGIDLEQNQPHDIVIQGNRIGTDDQGFFAVPNQGYGIYIFAASETLIGGPAAGGRQPDLGKSPRRDLPHEVLDGLARRATSSRGTSSAPTSPEQSRSATSAAASHSSTPSAPSSAAPASAKATRSRATRSTASAWMESRTPPPIRTASIGNQHRDERLRHRRSRQRPGRRLLREHRTGVRARRTGAGGDEPHRLQRGPGHRFGRGPALNFRGQRPSTRTADSASTAETTARRPTSLPERSSGRTSRSSRRPRRRPPAPPSPGTLASGYATTFTVHVFANPSCDPSGYGEARQYLGVDRASPTTAGAVTPFSGNLPDFCARRAPTSPRLPSRQRVHPRTTARPRSSPSAGRSRETRGRRRIPPLSLFLVIPAQGGNGGSVTVIVTGESIDRRHP